MPSRTPCATCEKEKATATCAGCLQSFCGQHFTDRRQLLDTQFEEIEVHRDLFRQTLLQQITEPKTHPLMLQVDQWEQNSIRIIQEAAEETRLVLATHTTGHTGQLEEKLSQLTDELRQSRQENDIIESDLQRWKEELEQLTEEFNKPMHIIIQQGTTPLINQLQIEIAGQ